MCCREGKLQLLLRSIVYWALWGRWIVYRVLWRRGGMSECDRHHLIKTVVTAARCPQHYLWPCWRCRLPGLGWWKPLYTYTYINKPYKYYIYIKPYYNIYTTSTLLSLYMFVCLFVCVVVTGRRQTTSREGRRHFCSESKLWLRWNHSRLPSPGRLCVCCQSDTCFMWMKISM